ncbi:hypothetical protein DFH08DRAFT_822196 [Mycena albidolilacea]|uniref:Uncharacterized protein n=1 Tax=Mycena albidolilacea TaxID=1033008 RepID=A0AAD7ECL3_9AGAR|nr:hypothetical protein DFH08DRAFT_822196 [Mycena albidolilacea]
MLRVTQTASHQHRGTGEMFSLSQPIPGNAETESDDNGDNLQESDMESDTEEDIDYFEAWEAQPKPRMYDEHEERQLEKREKAAAKHHAAEMRRMKVILAERGYTKDTNGKTLIGDCKVCKLVKARKPHLEGASADEEYEMYGEDGNDTEEEDEEHPVDCCMRCLLSLQPDFTGQKSQLELLIAATPGMDLVDEGLWLCPLPTIHWFYRRAHRYGIVYRLGATGPIAEFAVKKYRSHRGVRATELVDATVEWKARAEAMSRGVVLVKGKGKQKAK